MSNSTRRHLEPYLILILALASISHAATITYDFNITWVTANPDGAFNRPTIGINGKWPIPQITATKGDRVIVNVVNGLGNQSTSLHFHGLYQNGTTHMDGAAGASQCSIRPGGRFTYDFKVSLVPRGHYHTSEGRVLKIQRSINRAPIGITPMTMGSTRMASEVHSSCTIQTTLTKIFTMRSWYSLFLTGITIRWPPC